MRAEGWLPELPEGALMIKNTLFQKGDAPAFVTHPHSGDMERIEKAIYEAQMMCDAIIVSVHSHELAGDSKENPGDFLVEFAHRCIDAGAHAVIGHGPHLLRPLEIYKNRPIFYSLGDFIFQEEVSPYAPEDLYELYGLTSDSTMRELYRIRTKDYTRGLMSDRRFLESVVPYFEMENGELTRRELMPIELGFDAPRWQVGWPRPAYDKGIIERFRQLSAPCGTKIDIENGLGIIVL
jgi:poly-gamma-glutamate synthesis protein (capsule biosynthesis protein)